jgi:hypothetical protein
LKLNSQGEFKRVDSFQFLDLHDLFEGLGENIFSRNFEFKVFQVEFLIEKRLEQEGVFKYLPFELVVHLEHDGLIVGVQDPVVGAEHELAWSLEWLFVLDLSLGQFGPLHKLGFQVDRVIKSVVMELFSIESLI